MTEPRFLRTRRGDGIQRATFASRYALARQPHKKADRIRLMDCNLSVMDWHHAQGYMSAPGPNEFAVYDTVTRQKGYFETPSGHGPNEIGAMIEGHFAKTPCMIAERLWVV